MKIAMSGHKLSIKDVDQVQFAIIASWNLMKWDRQNQCFGGIASLELLEKLASITTLPSGGISPITGKPYPNIAEYYQNLRNIRDAVDEERLDENPTPIYEPPVKSKLYKHQIRGYNMALLTFGWAELGGDEN